MQQHKCEFVCCVLQGNIFILIYVLIIFIFFSKSSLSCFRTASQFTLELKQESKYVIQFRNGHWGQEIHHHRELKHFSDIQKNNLILENRICISKNYYTLNIYHPYFMLFLLERTILIGSFLFWSHNRLFFTNNNIHLIFDQVIIQC